MPTLRTWLRPMNRPFGKIRDDTWTNDWHLGSRRSARVVRDAALADAGVGYFVRRREFGSDRFRSFFATGSCR